MNWRERLRDAIERSGRKHGMIAEDARIAPATLSNVLTGKSKNPHFETVVRIAHAAGVNVGWLLREEGYSLTRAEAEAAVKILRRLEETFRTRGDR